MVDDAQCYEEYLNICEVYRPLDSIAPAYRPQNPAYRPQTPARTEDPAGSISYFA